MGVRVHVYSSGRVRWYVLRCLAISNQAALPMRWEAALSLGHDDRCDCQMNDPEAHIVMAHATHPRQLQEGASQGLRESELETKRPAKRIGVGGRGFTHGCHFSNAGYVRDGADSEWIIQLVNARNSLGRLRLYAARRRHSCQNQIVQSAPTPVPRHHWVVLRPSDDSINPLLEGVCPGAPPGQEGCQSDGLEGLGNGGDTDGVEGTLLLEHLDNELRVTTC